MSEQVEIHERQFTGTFAHRKLHDKVESGDLTAIAAWLVMVIDSLSKGDRGCYASNAFLGKKINKSEQRVRVLLSSLEDNGMLISKWVGDERRLWIDWSCNCLDKRSDNYVKNGRPLENERLRPLENKRLETSGKYIKNISNNRSERGTATPVPTQILPIEEKTVKKKDITQPILDLADMLGKAYCRKSKCKKPPFNKFALAKSIKGVVDNYGEMRLTKIVSYYCNNKILHKNNNELIIQSVKHLSSCINWIEDCMKLDGTLKEENYEVSHKRQNKRVVDPNTGEIIVTVGDISDENN